MALKLRYNDKSIVLTAGQLLIGRSVECNLVVSDPLASRRHAMLTMSKSGAFVTDLGSKAGVVVNGAPISGARKLATGDVLQLATVRVVVEDVDAPDEATDPRLRTTLSPPPYATVPAGFRLAPTPPLGLSRVERLHPGDLLEDASEQATDFGRPLDVPRLVGLGDPAEPRPPAPRGSAPESSSRAPASDPDRRAAPAPRGSAPESSSRAPASDPDRRTAPAPPDSASRVPASDPDRRTAPAPPDSAPRSSRSREDDPTAPRIGKQPPLPSFPRPDNLRALAGMADKAIALHRPEDAERIVQRALLDTLDAVRHGEDDAPVVELAASLGARLASALGAGRWFDFAVELYAARAELMPAAVVDQLLDAVRKAKPIDKAAFRRYLADARGAAGDSPARRFVIQRLEGVQRILDLK